MTNTNPQENRTGLREFTRRPWNYFQADVDTIWQEPLAYTVFYEARERLTFPLEMARIDLEDKLRECIDRMPDQEAGRTAYRIIEDLYSLKRREMHVALILATGAKVVVEIEGMLEDALESALENVYAQIGIRTVQDADDFIKATLRLLEEDVRKLLPDYPEDWHRLERSKERYEAWSAEVAAKYGS